jgi:hypothetical protein
MFSHWFSQIFGRRTNIEASRAKWHKATPLSKAELRTATAPSSFEVPWFEDPYFDVPWFEIGNLDGSMKQVWQLPPGKFTVWPWKWPKWTLVFQPLSGRVYVNLLEGNKNLWVASDYLTYGIDDAFIDDQHDHLPVLFFFCSVRNHKYSLRNREYGYGS